MIFVKMVNSSIKQFKLNPIVSNLNFIMFINLIKMDQNNFIKKVQKDFLLKMILSLIKKPIKKSLIYCKTKVKMEKKYTIYICNN